MINYSNVFFNYSSEGINLSSTTEKEHKLIYMYSGEITIKGTDTEVVINKGECVFIRKDTPVNIVEKPKNGEQIDVIYMLFNRNSLQELYRFIDIKFIRKGVGVDLPSVVKLPDRPDITSLFESFTPYFLTTIEPSEEVINLKIQEGIYLLLSINENFYNCLFDMNNRWKFDINKLLYN